MLKRLVPALQHPRAPLLLLGAAAVLAYGLVLARTGFYWDDLPMSWIRYQLGPQAMQEYFSTNRPVWGWLFQLTTRMLPQVPIFWQAFALFWRWVCAALVWGIGRELWPGRNRFALGLGLLFLLYPGFNAQWTAYLYSHFFIVLAFFLFSLLCSLISLRKFVPLVAGAGIAFLRAQPVDDGVFLRTGIDARSAALGGSATPGRGCSEEYGAGAARLAALLAALWVGCALPTLYLQQPGLWFRAAVQSCGQSRWAPW